MASLPSLIIFVWFYLVNTLTNAAPVSSTSSTTGITSAPVHIPSLKQDLTAGLIGQTIGQYPQTTGTIHCAIPYLADGLISFCVQLEGLADTLMMNASTTIPAGVIGNSTESSSLVLVPKTMKGGTLQFTTNTALIIAVGVYSPNYVTYYVQLGDGTVHELLSDNKVHEIDLIDPNAPAELTILTSNPSPSASNSKRGLNYLATRGTTNIADVLAVQCDQPCPSNMLFFKNAEGRCGCAGKKTGHDFEQAEVLSSTPLTKRRLEDVSYYSARMTEEACAAMTCVNNGWKPAIFNPFTMSCYCASANYADYIPSSASRVSSKAKTRREVMEQQEVKSKNLADEEGDKVPAAHSLLWTCSYWALSPLCPCPIIDKIPRCPLDGFGR